MSDVPLSADERAHLIEVMRTDDEKLSDIESLTTEEYHRTKERYYATMGEYFDRLPRVLMALCPICGVPYKHSFDPYGLDGPWWFTGLLCNVEEPAACDHFQVLLGALDLRGREPAEADDAVQPGPPVPFVIPTLMARAPEGMTAVMSELSLETGDLAYPIAYFAEEEVSPWRLHQSWLRTSFWFNLPSGDPSWSTATDVWDFELRPWVEKDRFCWVDKSGDEPKLRRRGGIHECPYLDLPGDRQAQLMTRGERILFPPPDGKALVPFD